MESGSPRRQLRPSPSTTAGRDVTGGTLPRPCARSLGDTIVRVQTSSTLRPDALMRRLREVFPEVEGSAPLAVLRAPGRVNLIGEHTDYNGGFVLPVAIDLEIRLAVAWTGDRRVRLVRDDRGDAAELDLAELPAPAGAWQDYVAGTAWSLAGAGLETTGFCGLLASDLPIGAGLSSSAALELASAWALSGPEGPQLPPLEIARLGQRAENDYVGVRCGLMDQFASACGMAGHALLLDCRSHEWRPVPLPQDLALVVIHSGVTHAHGDNEYNARRADCERVVEVIRARHPGVTSLRDVDIDMLEASRTILDDQGFRRARHVITENDRVLQAIDALVTGRHVALGRLMAASQASMRDDYEISAPEIETLVEIAISVPGVIGSRMTGGGFGGSTVTLVRPDAAAALRERVEREYPARTGIEPRIWQLTAVDGAGRLET